MRLNDDDYVIEKFPTRLRHDINLDGDLTIGANRLKGDGESLTTCFDVFVMLNL